MKVLHLAAGNRWTGAAAPAFAEVEALRAAGVDAHYAYVGGYKLQEKIGHHDFAHPAIEKRQHPVAFGRTFRALDRLIESHGFDVIHSHLTYDHWLARFIARGRTRVARTFHARRVLRTDPFTRSLVARTDLLFVINETFRGAPALRGREAFFTPPPVDHRQFFADGPDVRAQYRIGADEKLLVVIGKLAPERGFEEALRTFARVRTSRNDVRLMIIGHGPHRPLLEALASELAVAPHVIWAGYHEDDLAEHYRAGDLLLFTARGSDEGHRAVLEAMACGIPPATYPIDGVHALLGAHAARCAAPEETPEALAATVLGLLSAERIVCSTAEFSYGAAARRLLRAYSSIA